jgi:hypothetical protein
MTEFEDTKGVIRSAKSCIICSLICSFWLLLWYLYTFEHCIVCSLVCSFWLHRQYNGQKCKDNKGVTRSHKSMNRQYNGQKCKDTNGVIRTCKSLLYVLWFTASDYLHWYFYTLDQCSVCPLIYSFWLPHWYFYPLDQCIVCSLIYSFWLPHWYRYQWGNQNL